MEVSSSTPSRLISNVLTLQVIDPVTDVNQSSLSSGALSNTNTVVSQTESLMHILDWIDTDDAHISPPSSPIMRSNTGSRQTYRREDNRIEVSSVSHSNHLNTY